MKAVTYITLLILLFASIVTGYHAAHELNNAELANWCLVFFSLFWAGILALTIKSETPKN